MFDRFYVAHQTNPLTPSPVQMNSDKTRKLFIQKHNGGYSAGIGHG
jgi:hypothetical protein